MVGINSDNKKGNIFADGELQWLYETLEAIIYQQTHIPIQLEP